MVVGVSRVTALLRRIGELVTVEPYRGVSAAGAETHGAGVSVRMYIEQITRLDRGGDELVTSEGRSAGTRAWCALDTDAPIGSRVTRGDGSTLLVVEHRPYDGGRAPVPSHLELRLK